MPKKSIVLSHWPKLIEGLDASPLQFYTAVEAAISRRRIPDTVYSRTDWKEGGVLSAHREYLRVKRGVYLFDVCGAPFGTGFFVSTWLVEERNSALPAVIALAVMFVIFSVLLIVPVIGIVLDVLFAFAAIPIGIALIVYLNKTRPGWDDFLCALPLLGPLYEFLFRRMTYYQIDTAVMFQQAVQAAVMEVVDSLMEAKGLRVLSEIDRKPVMKALTAKA